MTTGRYHTICLLGTLLLFPFLSYSQEEGKFPKDSVEFLETVEDFLTETRKEEGETFIEEKFTPVWYSGAFSEHERERVYQLANFLAKENVRAFPHFKNFFESLVEFKKAGRSRESFDLWIGSIQQMLAGRNKRRLNRYLETTKNLFSENILYKSLSTTWQVDSSNYTIKYEEGKPVIDFGTITLKCYAKGDSTVIFETKGRFFPTEFKWKGTGGKVTWERAGFDKNTTYATLKDYEVKLRSPRFEADSVLFYNTFFDKPLKGDLTERVLSGASGKDAIYPKFESYNKRLSIPDIDKNVTYNGGFTVSGAKLMGSGTQEDPAKVTIEWKGKTFLTMRSQNFTISPEKITSQNVGVLFNFKGDSIFHPEVNLKFDRKERLLTLIRNDKGKSKSPYLNSFHELEMYFEALFWEIDNPLIKFSNLKGSTKRQASFESTDFFTPKRYESLVSGGSTNPFIKIKSLTSKIGTREFSLSRLAKHMRLPKRQVRKLLIQFSNQNFVFYDDKTKQCRARQKLFNYILNNRGKKDYDNLLINSEVSEGKNAKFSLLDYKLTIYGIKRVDISQVQKVAFFPDQGQVTVHENRDMSFSGGVTAGKMEFFGKDFRFFYDKFKVDLPQLDSALIWTPKLGAIKADRADNEKPSERQLVRSTIENLAGTLRIDAPNNKSGMKKKVFPRYPILNSKKKSFVYYDDASIHDGVYSREDFYFQLEPFTMDSLDNFPNSALNFKGTFSSGGIFPDFEETLSLQKDHSLGFKRKTPKEGFPMYGENITFNNKISLSNEGLKGDGTIHFLTSKAKSASFNLFPDSTTGMARSYKNQEKGQDPKVPHVKGKDVFVKYIPGDKKLLASKEENPLQFYHDEVKLHGGLALSREKMTGHGTMEFEKAELSSEEFHFKRMIADADTASFNLTGQKTKGLTFQTDNVNAHVDFEKRKAEFKSNGENTFIDFPKNDYICYMDKFNWFMDRQDIELEASEEMQQDININTELDLSKTNFYSVHPDQDSLSFMSPRATYSIEDNLITAHDVPYIPVADARIAPDSGIVRIEKNADMQTLKNAEILANTVTKHHRIHNAQVDIFAKKDYSGSGTYHYIDKNKKKQSIHFNNISVNKSGETYGTGSILKEDEFTLSPHFNYYGDVQMEASRKALEFIGNVQIEHTCDTINRNWFSFRSTIDPENIFIPYDKEKNSEMSSGVVLAAQDPELYPTFLSEKRAEEDKSLMEQEGVITFNEKAQEYRIGTKKKLRNRDMPGAFISLHKKSCKVKGNGPIDMGGELGIIETQNFGTITKAPEQDYKLNTTLTLDFFMNEDALEEMADHLNEHPKLTSFDFSKKVYENSLRELVGVERSDELISQLSLKGEFKKFPEELNKSLVLSDVNFVWDENTTSYRSKGSIGVANILEEQVFKNVKGHIVLSKHRKADKLSFYLELDENNWYYFSYRKGVMQAISSNEDFNTVIEETMTSLPIAICFRAKEKRSNS